MYENTFLGVIIDHKLCWKSHINHVKTKMSKSIAILNRIKHILNEKTIYIYTYCSVLIVPYITFCVVVWGHTYKTNLNSIYRLQKSSQVKSPLFI